MDRSSAERVCAPRRERGLGMGLDPSPEHFLLLVSLKMEHFDAVFKLDLMEENKKIASKLKTCQLQEEEAVASSCLILAMPIKLQLEFLTAAVICTEFVNRKLCLRLIEI